MELIDKRIDELFKETVQRYPDKEAVTYEEAVYTWKELDILSDALAGKMQKMGVARGDRAGIWSENSAAWVITFIALHKIGAVATLLNFNYKRRELEQAISIGDIEWLFYGNTPTLRREEGLIGRIRAKLRGSMDISGAADETAVDESPAFETDPNKSPEDIACILYTTGTSMDPKAVIHGHISLVNNARFTAQRAGLTENDCICVSQPLFHIFGLITSLIGGILMGAKICILSVFTSESILGCVQKHGCTILNGVPTNFICMITNPAFEKFSTSTLRLSIIGGSAISGSQLDYIRNAFPTVRVMRNYGLTEGCNLCNTELTDADNIVNRCVGMPYPNIDLQIMEPGTGRLLPAGEKGEIVVKGYSAMRGYYCSRGHNPPVQAIDEEGWLHTGDLGKKDKDGRISIEGRIKDIIIRGGENISPNEVSKEILRYEPILDSIVMGVPHPLLGEEVIACLTLETPEDYLEDELRSILKVRLSRFKIPEFFLVYDAFPLKQNGKVDMLSLKEDVLSKVKELHKGDERYHALPG